MDYEFERRLKKMCHDCLKWQPIEDYKEYNSCTLYPEELLQSNNCLNCLEVKKASRDYINKRYFKDAEPFNYHTHKELVESYECAFIGNTDYKDICNVYGIKHEEL